MLKRFSQNLRSKPTSLELSSFAREMKFLLEAGIPLLRALSIIERQLSGGRMRPLVVKISEDVSGGVSLSAALAARCGAFPEIFVNIVEAGEACGALETSLERIASYFETKDNLRKKIISSMVYPGIVLSLSFACVFFIAAYLVPTMNGIMSGMNAPLPPLTRAVGMMGNAVSSYWHISILSLLALFFLMGKALRKRSGDGVFDRLMLKLPIVGLLLKGMILSRVSGALSSLINAGVPLISSLKVASQVAGSESFREGFASVIRDVEDGGRLSEAFKKTGLFPDSYCELVSLGEATARLGNIFGELENYYGREIEGRLKVLVSLVEPLSTILVGIVVAVVVLSMFMPLMSMVDALAK